MARAEYGGGSFETGDVPILVTEVARVWGNHFKRSVLRGKTRNHGCGAHVADRLAYCIVLSFIKGEVYLRICLVYVRWSLLLILRESPLYPKNIHNAQSALKPHHDS